MQDGVQIQRFGQLVAHGPKASAAGAGRQRAARSHLFTRWRVLGDCTALFGWQGGGASLKSRPMMTLAEREELFRRFQEKSPSPQTELEYSSPYTLLVAVVLSAQATDVGVNKATGPLFAVADTPAKIVALGEEKVRDYIKTIGLYRNKAKNVIALSRILLEQHGGEIPRDREALEALPGVGRKTANVVLNVAFGEETMAVDTHIFRLSNRLGLAPGKTPLEVELKLLKRIPKPYMRDAHHWLILHGRYICKARKPDCPSCFVSDLCKFKAKTTAEAAPAPKTKSKAKAKPKARAKSKAKTASKA
ncbi:endonuclease III [Pyruvatibacter mobilis]|uniref:endonuclease III n=1 Tax=Pyruvatibacter mobilis TaxID=1712261 RepID=UPI003BACB9E3